MVRILTLKPVMSDEDAEKILGNTLSARHCRLLVNYDADVYDEATGKVLAKFRRNIIPPSVYDTAFENLKMAASPSMNRGTASGNKKMYSTVSTKPVRKAGYKSNTVEISDPVKSGIIGYFDRNPRFPYCRQTAYNLKHFGKFKKAYPIIRYVDDLYRDLMPDQYRVQRELADKSSQDFVIKGTSFTTITVNKNWQTAAHYDAGDLREGFGNLIAIRRGKFTGAYLTLVKWGVGFDIQNGDILLMDVHELHGNTPFGPDSDPDFTRLSMVMYYRENIQYCGTKEEEADRAKLRKPGDSVNKATI